MWRLLRLFTCLVWILLREGVSFAITTVTKPEVQLVDSNSRPNKGDNNAALPAVEATTQARSVVTESERVDCRDGVEEEVADSTSNSVVSSDIGGEDFQLGSLEERLPRSASEEDFVLRLLQLPCINGAEEAARSDMRLETVVDQVQAVGHRGVRFSVEADSRPASVAVLGRRSNVSEACKALIDEVPLETCEDRCAEHVFLVHFTMRETWDLPQDDALADASVGSDWVDLGREGDLNCPVIQAEERDDDNTEVVHQSPRSVLRQRLREVLVDAEDLYVFMDESPLCPSHAGTVNVDFVGRLPSAWQGARRAILACEAHGVYLSHRFEVLFWPPPELRDGLQDQVKNAVSHCQDASERISTGGFGLACNGIAAFEALADNVSAILQGHPPPGWHRLEWTPHGTSALPCHTY
jgi:hypothetical protein